MFFFVSGRTVENRMAEAERGIARLGAADLEPLWELSDTEFAQMGTHPSGQLCVARSDMLRIKGCSFRS
eukprot:3141670-Amphidinium_carterae.1